MKRKLIMMMIVLLGLEARQAAAQEKPRYYGGMGYFSFGGQHQEQDKLNDRLRQVQHPGISSKGLVLGGGGYMVVRNILVGGEGFQQTRRTIRYQGRESEWSSGGGMFQIGYLAYSGSNLFLYPLAGYGGSSSYLTIHEDTGAGFDEVLQDPKRSAPLELHRSMLNAALGLSYFTGSGSTASGGLMVGLKAGLTYGLGGDGWQLNGRPLAGAPDAARAAYYLQLTFGGGGLYNMKSRQ